MGQVPGASRFRRCETVDQFRWSRLREERRIRQNRGMTGSGDAPGTPDVLSDGETSLSGLISEAMWLWTPPNTQLPPPPVLTRLAELPVNLLTWENTERLFLRMLERHGAVQWAKLYGTRGQDQQGIDAYARLRTAGAGPTAGPDSRPYAVLQSRRVKRLTASNIDGAIADFLAGDWPAETGTYIFATSYDLTDTGLDAALRRAAESLDEKGIEFLPWGSVQVSERLRSHADLVDDFFGRAWVEPFCGPEGLEQVRDRLVFADAQTLRERLAVHYVAVFDAQNAVPRSATQGVVDGPSDGSAVKAAWSKGKHDFVVVDVTPRSGGAAGVEDVIGTGVDSRSGTGSDARARADQTSPTESAIASDAYSLVSRTELGRPRRSLRAVEQLLGDHGATAGDKQFRQAADDWLASGRRTLLVGAPGAGKSSLLRFVARDLLSPDPQSAALHQAHGGRLPVWLPFGFLSRHLSDSDANSLESAITTWLQARGMADMWPLVNRALSDDRLLLLVDGIDEWKSPAAANLALGAVESFLGQHPEAAAVLSSRPYGVERLAFSLPWQRADVAELDDEQRYALAAQYLAPTTRLNVGRVDEAAAAWDRAHVEPFFNELSGVPELAVLTRTPLFLALLATIWRGEPLPPKRFALYSEVVDLMVRRHPQMRRRFSTVVDLPLDEREFKALMEAVAYMLVGDGRTDPVPVQQMQRLMQLALRDEDVLGFSESESRSMAVAAMRMAEDEFGLLVPQGADHVGFIHRVLLDHLAGRRLARLPSNEQAIIFDRRLADPAWLDVLLSALTAQSNPHAVGDLLDGLLTESGEPGSRGKALGTAERRWPYSVRQHDAATELLAHALAAEVQLAPRKVTEYLARLVEGVERSPNLEHRAGVVTALVKACANPGHRRRLLPTFKRWLDATRPYPGAALYALRDLAVPDERAETILVHAMRDVAGDVRANAAHAYAQRFGTPRDVNREASSHQSDGDAGGQKPKVSRPRNDSRYLDLLIRLVREGPSVGAQAAGLLAMATGWPDETVTHEHLAGGRRQSRPTLRITSMYLLLQTRPEVPVATLLSQDEIEWVLGEVRQERWFAEHEWTTMTHELVLRIVSEAPEDVRSELADLTLETLRTNGQTGGNRALCWELACGPLADDDRLRDWVATELNSQDEHPLILFNVDLIPSVWREYPPMKQGLADYAAKNVTDIVGSAPEIAESLPAEQAKMVLLNGLTGVRPQRVAWRLVRDFAHDEEVISTLRDLLMAEEGAGTFASVAVDVLGIEAGFARIYALLVDAIRPGNTVSGEEQVLLANAVATEWHSMREALAVHDKVQDASQKLRGMAGTSMEERVAGARRVLADYDEREVCAACTAVDTYLNWHIATVILTWPEHTADYAIATLRSNGNINENADDTIHSAALRAHVDRPDPDSRRVVDVALDLMSFLEPEIREVLAHELCRSSLGSVELQDAFSGWKNDPDDGVRQTVAVGMTQVLLRESLGLQVASPQMLAWRASVREDLRSRGRNMDQIRRNAWASMLLLGDLSLTEGRSESEVDLSDIYGVPDAVLVRLVASRWEELRAFFGDDLLPRLATSRLKTRDEGSRVLRALKAMATMAGHNEAVAELVDEYVAQEETAQLGSGRPGEMLRLTIPVIESHKLRTGGDATSLDRVLQAADAARHETDRHHRLTRWALSELLDVESWWVGIEDIRQMLAAAPAGSSVELGRRAALANRFALEQADGQAGEPDAWDWERAWIDTRFSHRRAVWTMLFPQDPLTQRWVGALSEWFAQGSQLSNEPASWLEVGALCLCATPAMDLPALIERLFHPSRLELLDGLPWELTVPLVHRLRHDPEAVEMLRSSLREEAVAQESPLFARWKTLYRPPRPAEGPEQETVALEVAARRVFVSAMALRQAGHLEAADVAACVYAMQRVDPRTVVVDPFTNRAGPIWFVGVGLVAES
jgi:hypothetical protein